MYIHKDEERKFPFLPFMFSFLCSPCTKPCGGNKKKKHKKKKIVWIFTVKREWNENALHTIYYVSKLCNAALH